MKGRVGQGRRECLRAICQPSRRVIIALVGLDPMPLRWARPTQELSNLGSLPFDFRAEVFSEESFLSVMDFQHFETHRRKVTRPEVGLKFRRVNG